MTDLDRFFDDIKGMTKEEVDTYFEGREEKRRKRMEDYIAKGGKFVTQEDIDAGRTSWATLDGEY